MFNSYTCTMENAYHLASGQFMANIIPVKVLHSPATNSIAHTMHTVKTPMAAMPDRKVWS